MRTIATGHHESVITATSEAAITGARPPETTEPTSLIVVMNVYRCFDPNSSTSQLDSTPYRFGRGPPTKTAKTAAMTIGLPVSMSSMAGIAKRIWKRVKPRNTGRLPTLSLSLPKYGTVAKPMTVPIMMPVVTTAESRPVVVTTHPTMNPLTR